jgi:hypothetical protein
MTLTTSARSFPRTAAAASRPAFGPLVAFVAATGAAFAPQALLPGSVSLPVAATLLFGFAALVALVAWRRPARQPNRLTYWDVSGALLFIGICLAALIEPEQAAGLIEARPAR